MKEFDFDELDKAVSSLMGNVKKADDTQKTTAPVQPQSVVPSGSMPADDADAQAMVPNVNAEVVNDTPLALDELVPEESSDADDTIRSPLKPVEASVASMPLAARRGGRFMDVVHPSSDMKTAAPTRMPSREGNTLQPVPARPAPRMQPSSSVTDTMMASSVKAQSEPQPDVPTAPAPTAEPEPATEETSTSEPWASPFLPDAQVEKRPLGGLASVGETGLSDSIAQELSKVAPANETDAVPSSKPSTEEVNVSATNDETTEQLEADDLQLSPDPANAPLPAELNNDLVAIESGQKSSDTESTHVSVAPLQTSTPTPSTSSLASSALTTSSISPQYKEQPSTGDTSHLPIYDNEAIHQPLAHPPKKKKGVLIVMMIVLVMLLGGGFGFLAYFLGLI